MKMTHVKSKWSEGGGLCHGTTGSMVNAVVRDVSTYNRVDDWTRFVARSMSCWRHSRSRYAITSWNMSCRH